MAAFSTRARSAVDSFAASIGVPVRPARDGSVSFRFAAAGTVTFTPAADGERLLVSLAWTPERSRHEDEARLLALAGRHPTTGRYMHAGLAPDNSYVLCLALDDADADLPAIDQSLRDLKGLRDGFV